MHLRSYLLYLHIQLTALLDSKFTRVLTYLCNINRQISVPCIKRCYVIIGFSIYFCELECASNFSTFNCTQIVILFC